MNPTGCRPQSISSGKVKVEGKQIEVAVIFDMFDKFKPKKFYGAVDRRLVVKMTGEKAIMSCYNTMAHWKPGSTRPGSLVI